MVESDGARAQGAGGLDGVSNERRGDAVVTVVREHCEVSDSRCSKVKIHSRGANGFCVLAPGEKVCRGAVEAVEAIETGGRVAAEFFCEDLVAEHQDTEKVITAEGDFGDAQRVRRRR